MSSEEIALQFASAQQKITTALELADGKGKFGYDSWSHSQGGGGRTAVLQKGNILEKGGVAFSHVYGPVSDQMADTLQMQAGNFVATGVSLIQHPFNPWVPIMHLNVRYFEQDNGQYWFGGGVDLTPHYVELSEAISFHKGIKEVCDVYHPEFYPKFKVWADEYFYLPHRNETRGVGGIFFDRLDESAGLSKERLLAFCLDIVDFFCSFYARTMLNNFSKPFNDANKHWQMLRRSRYVEFNLLYDRGTQFGLKTGGRVESILVSMPPMAQWEYDFMPPSDSKEAATLGYLRKGINWCLEEP